MMDSTWEDEEISNLCKDSGMVAVKFDADSDECKQFSQYYPVIYVPCVSFISGETGIPLEGTAGHISPADFKQRIQKVLEMSRQGPASTPKVQAAAQASGSTSRPPAMAPVTTASPQPSPGAQASTTLAQAASSTQIPPASTATSQSQQKELSKLEKAARLRQKMEEIHQRKEAQKEEEIKRKEIERRKVGQAVQKSMTEKADQQARRAAEEIRKEKEESRLAKERVREQIARDRAEKQSRYEANKREKEKTQAAAKETASTANEAPKRKVNMLKERSHKKTPKHLQRRKRDKTYVYPCSLCLKEYHAKGSLKRHLKIEHGPRLFGWCRRCEYHCNRRDNLRRHYIQVHGHHIKDLETIAWETLEQRNSRVWLETGEKQLAVSKPKCKQKRKTGKKTLNAVRRNLKRGCWWALPCEDFTGKAPTQSVAEHYQPEDSIENSSGTEKPGELVPVKLEAEEILELRSSPQPASSSATLSQDPDLEGEHWSGSWYQCPECVNTYHHSSSLLHHLQREHGQFTFFCCRWCSFRSERKEDLRKHYWRTHPLQMEDIDLITPETMTVKEMGEHLDLQQGIEVVAEYDQRLNESLSPRQNSSTYNEMPETCTKQFGKSSSPSPSASKIVAEQPANRDVSLAAEQVLQDASLAISQEDVSSVNSLFPVGHSELQQAPNSTSSLKILDSDNSVAGTHMSCSSEPVHTPADTVDAEWQVHVQHNKETVGCFKCPKCSHEFLQQGSLYRHLRLSHGPQAFFWCRYCEFRTNRKDNFKRHYKKLHQKHIGEVKKITVETCEEKESRVKHEQMKVVKLTKFPRQSKKGLFKAPSGGSQEETLQERGESVSVASWSSNLEEQLSVQMNESQSCHSPISQPMQMSPTNRVLSPRVQLVKIVLPEQHPAPHDAARHTGTDNALTASGSVDNTLQHTANTVIQEESHNPLEGSTAGSVITKSHFTTLKGRKSSKDHVTQSMAKVSLDRPQKRFKCSEVTDPPNSQSTSRQSVGCSPLHYPPSSATLSSCQRSFVHQQRKRNQSAFQKLLNAPQGNMSLSIAQKEPISQGNAALHIIEDSPVCSPVQVTSNREFIELNSQENAVDGSNKDVPSSSQKHDINTRGHSVLKSKHINIIGNAGHKSPIVAHHAIQNPLNSPQRNMTHNTGQFACSTPQITAKEHKSPNVKQNRLQGSQNSVNLQGQCAACTCHLAEDLWVSPQDSAANHTVREESPVTSTSESPCIPLTRLEEVLRGKVTKVTEESHTVIYQDGKRIKEETVKRTYEVMFEADFGNRTVTPRY
ncbi:uncharacterized protein LOC110977354 isoform X2 [Acanthaster planci]|nr:uncharacterized protein LOC110977354 isoform X2 [Acanthaster planci]